ncbi:CinA family protein [Janibacter sp. CX7]|uniref:CinA family protein n=1 Tax=unclassified Janibacter TaxID=2649294 RepID=UPI0020CD7A97|nr:CinA family protein [Janibacter sp. CX7]UTT65063.1 CinA family protein [Janibacter sp. CX7]
MIADGAGSADAAEVLAALARRGWTLGTAESLTGGLLAATVVEVPGASSVFAGSVVAYDPAVKISLLGVDPALVDRVGTVDEQVATQMAQGARRALGVDLALATTGVAGPGPSEGHPAGTVWLACASPSGLRTRRLALTGERPAVRAGAVQAALDLARDALLTVGGDTPDR